MTTPSASTGEYNERGVNSIWFEDGNIIIKCSDSVRFRVYRGILALHSEVFRNMFVVGQASQSELSDGVAVVEVTEDSTSMCLLLEILFAPHTTRPLSVWTKVSDLCDLLDLSSKYMVEFIYKEAARYLREVFPKTMDDYETPESFDRINYISVNHYFKVISTAQRHGLRSILPSAFLSLCVYHYSELDSWPNENPALALQIITTCAKAYPKLLRLKRQAEAHITEALLTASFRDPPKPVSCESHYPTGPGCISMARKALIMYMTGDRNEEWSESAYNPYEEDFMSFGPDDFLCDQLDTILARLDDVRLCDTCLDAWRSGEQVSRNAAWQELPVCFGLGSWKELVGNL